MKACICITATVGAAILSYNRALGKKLQTPQCRQYGHPTALIILAFTEHALDLARILKGLSDAQPLFGRLIFTLLITTLCSGLETLADCP
jgi:hypothetical protein